MTNFLTLDQLSSGQAAVISRIVSPPTLDDALVRQCHALGLSPGSSVVVLRQSIGKGPMQVKSQGSYYAIRAGEAACIQVARDTQE